MPDPFATTGHDRVDAASLRLWPSVLLGWAIAAAMLVLVSIPAIVHLRFPDPDDAMRLLEVRDWLAGQSWWDVAQHRLNHGDFPMHWSRLVDLPIAAAMLVLEPLCGVDTGDRAAAVLIPLVTLLLIMALLASITRRLAGIEPARFAVLVAALSMPIMIQVRPLRIDHHGWQIVLALAATRALLGRPTAACGAVAGMLLGVLVTVSLEGMPVAASIAGVAAIAWALDPRRGAHLVSLGWSLVATASILHVLTRGPAMLAPACDAIAPAWLAAMLVAATGVTLATLAARAGLIARLLTLGATLLCAAAVLRIAAPTCLEGPFATLPPLVYRLWYLQVSEGRPLWEQPGSWALLTIGLPLAGVAGCVHALASARGVARARWIVLLALLLAATGVAVFVNRAGATANALAVPGAATLLSTLLMRARAIQSVWKRILATLGALLLASPGQVGAMVFTVTQHRQAAALAAATKGPRACDSAADVAALAALPPGVIFAPIDISPQILVTTRHRGVAAGYHRGAAAIDRVMRAFLMTPDRAAALVARSGADYLAICPGTNEIDLYTAQAPQGLAARLARGERVPWLAPIAIPGSPVLAWRVIRPLPGAPARP